MAPGGLRYGTLASIRDDNWKYILHLDDQTAELFDLRQDPREQVNRLKNEPSIGAHYDRLVHNWLAAARPPRPAWRDRALVERLRTLGYVR